MGGIIKKAFDWFSPKKDPEEGAEDPKKDIKTPGGPDFIAPGHRGNPHTPPRKNLFAKAAERRLAAEGQEFGEDDVMNGPDVFSGQPHEKRTKK